MASKQLETLLESAEPLLFSTKSGRIEHVVIEDALRQLFDYCLEIEAPIVKNLCEINSEIEQFRVNPSEIYYTNDPRIEFSRTDFISLKESFEIPFWENINSLILPSTQLILITILIERSLKSLCSEYSPDNHSKIYGGYFIKIKALPKKSKIETYLKYLLNKCNLRIEIPEFFSEFNSIVRNTRNLFVHGDWEEIEKNIDISNVFVFASDLFMAIEDAILNKNLA